MTGRRTTPRTGIPIQRGNQPRPPAATQRNARPDLYRTKSCPVCLTKTREVINSGTLAPVQFDPDPDPDGGWIVEAQRKGPHRARQLDAGETPPPGAVIVRKHQCQPSPAWQGATYPCRAAHCDRRGEPVLCPRCQAELAAWRALPNDRRTMAAPTAMTARQRAQAPPEVSALFRSDGAGTV